MFLCLFSFDKNRITEIMKHIHESYIFKNRIWISQVLFYLLYLSNNGSSTSIFVIMFRSFYSLPSKLQKKKIKSCKGISRWNLLWSPQNVEKHNYRNLHTQHVLKGTVWPIFFIGHIIYVPKWYLDRPTEHTVDGDIPRYNLTCLFLILNF